MPELAGHQEALRRLAVDSSIRVRAALALSLSPPLSMSLSVSFDVPSLTLSLALFAPSLHIILHTPTIATRQKGHGG